jgi:hypothetical protein
MTKRIILLTLLLAAGLGAEKFYPDDPIEREPAPRRVEKATRRKLSDIYDFFLNTFERPGEAQTHGRLLPAQGVNTLGEVPDGAWYVNRHGRTPMALEDLTRGSSSGNPPSMDGPWDIETAKSEGVTPVS